jgi:hypothetical protein
MHHWRKDESLHYSCKPAKSFTVKTEEKRRNSGAPNQALGSSTLEEAQKATSSSGTEEEKTRRKSTGPAVLALSLDEAIKKLKDFANETEKEQGSSPRLRGTKNQWRV